MLALLPSCTDQLDAEGSAEASMALRGGGATSQNDPEFINHPRECQLLYVDTKTL